MENKAGKRVVFTHTTDDGFGSNGIKHKILAEVVSTLNNTANCNGCFQKEHKAYRCKDIINQLGECGASEREDESYMIFKQLKHRQWISR